MTNEREPGDGAWDAEDIEDNEQTTVARNPLLGPPPAQARVVDESGVQDSPTVSVRPSSPSSPPSRPSLYDRLLASGAIEPDPDADASLNLPRSAVELPDLPAPNPAYARAPQQPPSLSSMGFATPPNEFERAYARAESEPPAERPSTMPLRDSDLEMVTRNSEVERIRRDSDGFISALAQDPDVDEPPVSARFKRPPELTPEALPPQLPQALPSVMLSPQMSTRHDSTERISTGIPKTTHPFANSVAPTSTTKISGGEERGKPRLLIASLVAAVAAAGVAVGVMLPGREPTQTVSVAATKQPTAEPSTSDVSRAEPPAPVAPVAPPAPVQEDEKSAAELADEAARERRHRLRAEREAAKAAEAQAAAAAPAAEAPAANAEPSAAAAPAPSEPKADQPKTEEPKPAEPAVAQGDGKVPAQPTRDQVVAAMNAVLPGLQECVGDKHGTADVTVTVRSAGFVSYAIVGGTFVGTPEGSCIAKVVRDAKFPPFSDPFIRVTYPFQL